MVFLKPAKQNTEVNTDLLSKLKALRSRLAQEKKVPAYIIFSDAALIDMCNKMPADEDEFLEVSGVGRVKLEAYGQLFLEVINEEEPV